WSGQSLTLAIANAILGALSEAELLSDHRELHLGERDGGYLRVHLQQASEAESALFSEALAEAMGPLQRPRYVIPRVVDVIEQTWLSRLLPVVVGRYFQRRRREMVMLHAVPTVLARNAGLAEIYRRHWNRHVSPGEVLYAHRGAGERMLQQARQQRQGPLNPVHRKEVFL